jgi:hypothetical protein
MGYFSSNEDFQSAEPFGCCDDCRRRLRQMGYAPLAEWYEIDKLVPPPARPSPAAGRLSSAVGETAPEPPPLVLPTQGLLDPPPPPPLPRNLREALARGWPPLRVPFRPSPGPPATPPRPDLRLSPEYQRKLNQKWEREREERKFNRPLPPPRQSASLQEEIDRYIDRGLNPLMDRLRVPTALRGPIRDSARATIGLNAGELLDRSLKQMRLGGETREAIRSSIRNVMRQLHTR